MNLRAYLCRTSPILALALFFATANIVVGQDLVPVSGKNNDKWNGMEELPAPVSSPFTIPLQEDGEQMESIDPGGHDGPEEILQRYPDGKVQVRRHVIQDAEGNYIHHGRWELFNRRGQVLAEGEFVNGEKEGPWQRWHPADADGIFDESPFNTFQGPFLSQATFADGKLNGSWMIYDRDNRKILEIPYVDGQRNGTAVWFWPDGSKMRHIQFTEGTLNGEMQQWDRQQRVTRRVTYDQGKELVDKTEYHVREQKKSEDHFLGAQLQVAGEDDWWNARLAEYETVGHEVQQGQSRTWYRNGQLKSQVFYNEGLRDGKFVAWHENGQKQTEGYFDNGAKNGLWTWWHANGMKAVQGRYDMDIPEGEWTWWDNAGQVTGRQGDIEETIDDDSERDPLEIID